MKRVDRFYQRLAAHCTREKKMVATMPDPPILLDVSVINAYAVQHTMESKTD